MKSGQRHIVSILKASLNNPTKKGNRVCSCGLDSSASTISTSGEILCIHQRKVEISISLELLDLLNNYKLLWKMWACVSAPFDWMFG
jgi:hypothetical protein